MDRGGLQACQTGARSTVQAGRQANGGTPAETQRPPEITGRQGVYQPADSPSDAGTLEGQRPMYTPSVALRLTLAGTEVCPYYKTAQAT